MKGPQLSFNQRGEIMGAYHPVNEREVGANLPENDPDERLLTATAERETTYKITMSEEELIKLEQVLIFYRQQSHPAYQKTVVKFANYLLNVINSAQPPTHENRHG